MISKLSYVIFLWFAVVIQVDADIKHDFLVDSTAVPSFSQSEKFTDEVISINGFVREEASGEPIPYANVYLAESNFGSSTNDDGYFLIQNVPLGKYQLRVMMMGYDEYADSLDLHITGHKRIDIRLTETIFVTEGVTVSAERTRHQKSVQTSQINLDIKDIQSSPALIEADVFRTLQMLPGVQSMNDFSSALYVRGSTPDQNLIMLDGITIYNPSHLGGLFSTFNTDAISDAQFQAGGFPARYGGRLGSTLNIINREGNAERISGSGNVSMISSKGLIEGPLPQLGNIAGSWILSGRRTYLDQIVERLSDFNFPYHFYDYQIKANVNFGNNHRMTYSRFYGKDAVAWSDTFTEDDTDEKVEIDIDWPWGNRTHGLTWRWIARPTLIAKTFIANSIYDFRLNGLFSVEESKQSANNGFDKFTYESRIVDEVNDRSIESEIVWTPNEDHVVSFGTQYKAIKYDVDFQYLFTTEDTTYTFYPLRVKDRVTESSAFVQDAWSLGPLADIVAGLRVSKYSLHEELYLEPRFSAKYALNDQLFIKYSGGLYRQFLVTANQPDELFRIVDLWLGVPGDRSAPRSLHHIIGLEYLTEKNVLMRLEVYRKDFSHLLTLKSEQSSETECNLCVNETSVTALNDFWDTDAESIGLEALLKKTVGSITGWLGYTYADTRYFTENSGWYRPAFDRRHTLNAVSMYKRASGSSVSASLSYSTGNPYTPVIGRAHVWEDQLAAEDWEWESKSKYLVGKKNEETYASYLRLDVNFSKRWRNKDWSIQVVNLTNHQNPLAYQYRTKENPDTGEQQSVQRRPINMFPWMLTWGVRFEF